MNKANISNSYSMVSIDKIDDDVKKASDMFPYDKTPRKEETKFYEHLFRMASLGHIDSVKLIVEVNDVDLSKYDNNKHFNPIIYAASYSGNKELVQYLIDKGADPNAKTSGNETALHRAARGGHLDVVKLLVAYGADLNIIYNANGGLSPLSRAAESGNLEVVKYLVEKGADVNYTNESSGSSPLRSAAYEGNYEIFKYLAQMQPADYDWQEVLFYGLIGGNLDIVKYVVEVKGADVNKRSEIWNVLPIERAARDLYISNKNAQPLEVLKYLVSKGAKLSDINGGKVFEWAMEHSTEATIEYMIESGINVDISPTKDGWPPLALTLDNHNFVLAKHFIKKTEDHSFRGKPLVVYFADGMDDSPFIIDLLIKEGVNKEHYTEALFKSVIYDDSRSADLLLTAGADIKALYPDTEYNVLHFAADYRVAKLLIKEGADTGNKAMLEEAWKNPSLLYALQDTGIFPPISKPDMNTALADAAEKGDVWTVKYMLKRGADVNSYEDIPESEQQKDEIVPNENFTKEELADQERNREIEIWNKPGYKRTPLLKNAIQGYSRCNYGLSGDDNKIQISQEIAGILLEAGADPNMTDSYGRTALHYVSDQQFCHVGIWPIPMGNRRDREHGAHGDPARPPDQCHDLIGKLLIENGADLNAIDKYGNTPLILAAKNENSSMLKILLEAGADVDIKNNIGNDMFDYLKDLVSFNILRDAGLISRVSQERINNAFKLFFSDFRSYGQHDIDELKALIGYGADVNTKIYTKTNALMYTFNRIYGDAKWEIAQTLIDNGIDLNSEDNQGFTLVMTLIKDGEYKDKYADSDEPLNLLFLLKNGVDLNYKSSIPFSVLGIAICENRNDIVDLLVSHGAKRNLESEWWYMIKEKYHNKEIISKLRQLVKEGVDVNLQASVSISYYTPKLNQKGVTALMFFAAYGKEDVVKALLDMNADVNIKAEDGTTALSIAKNRFNQTIIDLLLESGASE